MVSRSVYLVGVEGVHDRLKIGSSHNPEGRVRQWQTGNPRKFKIEAVITPSTGDGYALEKALHERYDHLRICSGGGTEWFKSDDPRDSRWGNIWEFFYALSSNFLTSEEDLCAVVRGEQELWRCDEVRVRHAIAHLSIDQTTTALSALRACIQLGVTAIDRGGFLVVRGEESALVESWDTGDEFVRQLRTWAAEELAKGGVVPCSQGWFRSLQYMVEVSRFRRGSPAYDMSESQFRLATRGH